jgi:hypothetical protein
VGPTRQTPSPLFVCLCVGPTHQHPSPPLLDNEPHRLVVGSDLHCCSTRDVVALLLLIIPLTVDVLEEATEAAASAVEASTEAGLLDR